MKLFKFIFSNLLFLCMLACSNLSITETVEPRENKQAKLIFSIETNGGCMMMGPNCPRYELMSDGQFKVFRSSESEVASSSSIEMTLVTEWVNLIDNTSFTKLRSRLGEGECRACFDGIDFVYTIYSDQADEVLNSREFDFSKKEEFFQLSTRLQRAMQEAAPLEIKNRH